MLQQWIKAQSHDPQANQKSRTETSDSGDPLATAQNNQKSTVNAKPLSKEKSTAARVLILQSWCWSVATRHTGE